MILPMQRILSKISPEPNTGCWLWMGTYFSNGYGAIKIEGKLKKAHRMVYEILVEPISDDLCACHKCDNPSCVNPDHIFLGTPKDNGEDKARKGRSAKGKDNGNSKLTEEIVRKIRAESGTRRQIAKKYGLVHATVKCIKLRRTWAHLD